MVVNKLSYNLSLQYARKELEPKGDFPARVRYVPIINTYVAYNNKLSLVFPCVVDSGADYCIFPANTAEELGINIEKGKKLPMYGIGGHDVLYFHEVNVIVYIEQNTWQFQCSVGFSRNMSPKGVGFLGRTGFFNIFKKITFMEQDRKVILTGEGDRPRKFKQGGPLF